MIPSSPTIVPPLGVDLGNNGNHEESEKTLNITVFPALGKDKEC